VQLLQLARDWGWWPKVLRVQHSSTVSRHGHRQSACHREVLEVLEL
jgi:hypothetical protein